MKRTRAKRKTRERERARQRLVPKSECAKRAAGRNAYGDRMHDMNVDDSEGRR